MANLRFSVFSGRLGLGRTSQLPDPSSLGRATAWPLLPARPVTAASRAGRRSAMAARPYRAGRGPACGPRCAPLAAGRALLLAGHTSLRPGQALPSLRTAVGAVSHGHALCDTRRWTEVQDKVITSLSLRRL